ncbi:DUF805 domain-containing protein [Rhizobium sp. S95]|uniref:DUF805 domain-containing protein n=1 Tax=Ciceribacter sichuanensis TaxID=2949647 RepID=A0AAJ1BXH8_9HYPH|nr:MULTISPECIES: DUF805 domain-containing protein [unclassified Ciceribacter]MCM2396847.1 DUF805 domain-containing protein [Ciceribacter sp. S95]MCO5958061.1 DUF805 domain-containing protein [Ciceribacter sp. S101]
MLAAARRPTVSWLFFSPSGRAGRQTFILGWLFWLMMNSFALAKLTLVPEDDDLLPLYQLVFVISMGLSIVSAVMMSIKRLHDMNMPGLIALTLFIPAVSMLVLFLLCMWPSARRANAYGETTDWPRL